LTAPHDLAGRRAEEQALCLLKRRGLTCVSRNFRCRAGEIDLIMVDRGVLVFVEVRFRRGHSLDALASVDRAKQRKLLRAAETFRLARRDLASKPCRFDVIAVSGDDPDEDVRWIADAFEQPA